jgi:ABC-type bacteriocin/lantibiotic exporter with double-glycine peptidase domain
LSYQPEVLILDEALNALDESSAQELLQLILKAVPTVILVTHRQSLIQKFEHIYSLERQTTKSSVIQWVVALISVRSTVYAHDTSEASACTSSLAL